MWPVLGLKTPEARRCCAKWGSLSRRGVEGSMWPLPNYVDHNLVMTDNRLTV